MGIQNIEKNNEDRVLWIDISPYYQQKLTFLLHLMHLPTFLSLNHDFFHDLSFPQANLASKQQIFHKISQQFHQKFIKTAQLFIFQTLFQKYHHFGTVIFFRNTLKIQSYHKINQMINEIHNIVSYFYIFFKGQAKNQSNFMEDWQQSLELYVQYPLIHFQIYKKITSPNYYKATPYKRLSITLKKVVEILVEFLLLLLKASIKSTSLAIAVHPGILFEQKIHFYTLDSQSGKGFIVYKQKQWYQQIKKYVQTLSCVNIIERQEEIIQNQFVLLIECLNHYVEQAFSQKTMPKHHLNSESLSILNILTFLSTQKSIVKYSTIFQIKNSILSNRIIEKSVYLREDNEYKSQDNESTLNRKPIDQWKDRVKTIHLFLKDCEEREAIENLQENKQLIALQDNDSTQNQNEIEIVKLRFDVDIHQYKTSYQKQKSQVTRQQQSKCYSFKKIEIELVFYSDDMHFVDIKTQSHVQSIGKKDFYILDALWVKIQAQWMKVTVSMGAKSEIMSTKGIKIHHNEQKQLEIRERIKFHSAASLKQKIICSIDKQILQLFIIQPHFEDLCQNKKEETFEIKDKNMSFQQKVKETSLLLKKWTSYLQQKLTIFMDYEKQPLLLLK